MASFIWVQLKKTSEVDLAKPLVKFIQQTYPSGGEEQAQYCRAAEELSKLRRSALGRPLDKHEGALETLLRWARAAGLPSCPRSPPRVPPSQPRFLLPSEPFRLPRAWPLHSDSGQQRRCGQHSFLVRGLVTLPSLPTDCLLSPRLLTWEDVCHV